MLDSDLRRIIKLTEALPISFNDISVVYRGSNIKVDL